MKAPRKKPVAKAKPTRTFLSFRLVDDAGWVLHNAWSVRFNILAALFGGVTAIVAVLTAYAGSGQQVDLPIGPITLAVTAGVATVGAALAALCARFVKQDRPDPDASE